ncbi:MAG: glycosyltransferase [Solirubrobacteraceae bacterium]
MADAKETVGQLNPVRVAFVGSPAYGELPDGYESVPPDGDADVYHVSADQLGAVRDLRTRSDTAAIIVDLTGISAPQLDRSVVAIAGEADLIAVASTSDARYLEQRDRRLGGRVLVMPPTIDLERFAPDAELAASRRVPYSRFKRYHRLAPPTVLYAGAYVPDGGLAPALDAIYLLRDSIEDIRFASIPLGRVDRRHLDRCERRALILGHRGIVEWSPPSADEMPFWFATASVVLVAGDDAARPASLAAAAARPIVALDAAAAEAVGAGHAPPGDADALAAAIRTLLGPAGTAVGKENRRELVSMQSQQGLRLGQLWTSAARSAGARSTAPLRALRAESASAPSSSTVIHPR